jgi:hypothetical protein
MKKSGLFVVISVAMAFCLLAIVGTSAVLACTTVTGDGTTDVWEAETIENLTSEIPQNEITVAPPTDQQLVSTGAVVSGPTNICYPFSGGQYGWVGQIRMLSEGSWVGLPTTVKWVPDEEGKLMACAYAPAAGTYALFAYWSPE